MTISELLCVIGLLVLGGVLAYPIAFLHGQLFKTTKTADVDFEGKKREFAQRNGKKD